MRLLCSESLFHDTIREKRGSESVNDGIRQKDWWSQPFQTFFCWVSDTNLNKAHIILNLNQTKEMFILV